jgi:hypothetical protein
VANVYFHVLAGARQQHAVMAEGDRSHLHTHTHTLLTGTVVGSSNTFFIKGTGSSTIYYLKAYKIKTVLFVHDHMAFLCSLVKRKINTKFLLLYMKTLTNSKNCFESRIRISVPFPSFSLVDFLNCTVHRRLLEQFSESQEAFGII